MQASAAIKKIENGLQCTGSWTIKGITKLEAPSTFPEGDIQIEGHAIQAMDSAGALLLYSMIQKIQEKGGKIKYIDFKKEHRMLMDIITERSTFLTEKLPSKPHYSFLYMVGKEAIEKFQHLIDFLAFFGKFTIDFLNALKNPLQMQWITVLNIIEETGYRAMPIIALLLFLIGIVLTYQMGLQLKNYGANVFIVNLSGIAILREFAPLITAIIIAGRTSSSFTALISTMKVYEEIDALSVMGLSPMRRIVMPRVIGLFISLPLLTVWASIFGVLGSMMMANNMLEISYIAFLKRFKEVVELSEYWIGMSKVPVFAFIISIIGCYQGFEGSVSADNVGRQTTKSVVQAIFLIIIADAAFSVMYSWLGL